MAFIRADSLFGNEFVWIIIWAWHMSGQAIAGLGAVKEARCIYALCVWKGEGAGLGFS